MMPKAYSDDYAKKDFFSKSLRKLGDLFKEAAERGISSQACRFRGNTKKLFADHDKHMQGLFEKTFTREFLKGLRKDVMEDKGTTLPNFLDFNILHGAIKDLIEAQEDKVFRLAEEVTEVVLKGA